MSLQHLILKVWCCMEVIWFFSIPAVATASVCQDEGLACVERGTIPYRIALVIGHNRAGERADTLRYAETDARKMRDLLIQLGGYLPEDVWLLTGQPASVVERAMASIRRRIHAQRKQFGANKRIILFVYYSGHAQSGKLLLGQSTLTFLQLKEFMRTTQASLRLAVLDACESGRLLLGKGLKRRKEDNFRFPFVRLAPSATGEVIITATGQKESAHEDPQLRGGIFTHYLLSGLRGAADNNSDGHVTLEEAYTYSYNRALQRTIFSKRGPQRARFSKRLSGYGSLILTTLSQQRAWLWLHKRLVGEFFVWTPQRDLLLAEVVKNRGRAVMVALPPGQYILQWRRKHGLYHQAIQLLQGKRFRLNRVGQRLAYWEGSPVRGGNAPVSGVWKSFEGQLLGPGLGVSFQAGFSGIDRGVWQQGSMLHFLLPLDRTGTGRMSLLFQVGYQYGFDVVSETLKYHLHTISLDVGLMWTLLARPHWWLGTGVLLRGSIFVQSLLPRTHQPSEDLLSFGFGPTGLFSVQYGFGVRWFLQLNVMAGVRFLNLGGSWTARWDLNTSLGVGIRF